MNNFSQKEFSEIGKIIKTHGFKGEVLIHYSKKFDSLIKKELIFVLIDGIYVPFFIDRIYKKSNARYAIKLKDVDNDEIAAELLDKNVYTETSNIEKKTESAEKKLIGFKVYNKNVFLGKVTDFISMSSNDLIEINYKEHDVLIPYQSELIENFDNEKKEIRFDLPEGLLDLNL